MLGTHGFDSTIGTGPAVPGGASRSPDFRKSPMLKHKLIALSAALPLALAVAASSAPGGSAPTSLAELSPSAEQAAAARLVYGILSDSRYVYRAKPLDDALS